MQEKESNIKLRQLVEAVLFVSPNPIGIDEISKILGGNVEQIKKEINELIEEYDKRESAIEIREIGDNHYLMQLKPEFSDLFIDLVKPAIPLPMLKTLSLIALKQPVTQAEIIKSRGTSAYSHIKQLINMGFVHAERKGRTKVLRTTKKFSDYFGFSYDVEKLKKEIVDRLKIG